MTHDELAAENYADRQKATENIWFVTYKAFLEGIKYAKKKEEQDKE